MVTKGYRKLEKAFKVGKKIAKLNIKDIISDPFGDINTKEMRKLQKLARKSSKLFQEAING